jgi:hypothetical protein
MNASSERNLLRPARDAVECVVVLQVCIGEGVQVLLCVLDLMVTHAIHDAFQVRSAGEQPGRVRMA